MSDTIELNKKYFNKLASDYDERFREPMEMLERELRSSVDDGFIGLKQGGRVLDYACGTGLLTNALAEKASECVGVDISESMVEAYNAKSGREGATRKAYLGNLASPSAEEEQPLAGPEFFDFDFAGVGLGFHHFDDPSLASRRLAERLRPGGVLFIMDFLPHGSEAHAHAHDHHHGHHGNKDEQHSDVTDEELKKNGVKHLGFTRENVKAMFEAAGAGGDFGWRELPEPLVLKREDRVIKRDIFFARGTKN